MECQYDQRGTEAATTDIHCIMSRMKIQRPTNFIREFPFHDVEPVKKILFKHTGEYSGEYPFHIYRKLIFFLFIKRVLS